MGSWKCSKQMAVANNRSNVTIMLKAPSNCMALGPEKLCRHIGVQKVSSSIDFTSRQSVN